MYNAVRRSMESMSDFSNQLTSVNRRWMAEGQITDMPRAVMMILWKIVVSLIAGLKMLLI